MRFDFDPNKNLINFEKHGVSLLEAQKLWEDLHVIIPAKNVTGEKRFAILGTLDQKTYIAIFTKRGKTIRLISCHRADKKWERIFYELINKEQTES